MTDPVRRSSVPTWIALLAVAGLAAGGYAWWRQIRPVAPQTTENPLAIMPEAAPLTAADTALVATEGIIERALRGIATPADSVALRNMRVDEVKGVEVEGLTPTQLATFIEFANAERCTCGCGFTLAACRSYDPSCETSLPLAIALRDSIVMAGSKRSSRGR